MSLPKFSYTKETAQAVFDHVFKIHALPSDIVSDRGPQFISKFWRKFCLAVWSYGQSVIRISPTD